MLLTADTEMYGKLPMFPCLDYLPITEERIERAVERLMDAADRIFLSTDTTQAQYDAWCKQLNKWAREQEEKIAA